MNANLAGRSAMPTRLPLPSSDDAGLLRYVRTIARRLHRSAGAASAGAIELEDLESEAYLGLVRAVRSYDRNRGVPLRGHVGVQVSGHLRHVLRRCDPAGRSNRQKLRAGKCWAELATHDLGRHPTHAEVEATVPGYRAACAAAERLMPVPLDAVGLRTAAPVDVADLVVQNLDGAALWRLVEQLPSSGRAAVKLRYHDGLGVGEVATALGLTRAGARAALWRALRQLRSAIGPRHHSIGFS